MTSDVTDLIAALRDGSMSLEDVARRFRERSWPRRRKPRRPLVTWKWLPLLSEDPDPYVPGSFDDVVAAYHRGELDRVEYRKLAEAAAESLRAEYQRTSSEQADQA